MPTYKFTCSGCDFTYSDSTLAFVRREGRGHLLHVHGDRTPQPHEYNTLITSA